MFRAACTLLAALSCATAVRAQAPSAIRTGTYDLEVTIGGGVLEGTLIITSAGDSLGATLKVGGHDSPVRPGQRQGSKLTLEATGATQVRYQLEFKGDDVTGSFVYDGEPGTIAGKRRRSAGS